MWGDINILCQVSIPFLRGLRVRKIKFSLFCPQPKRLVEIALDGKWITDGRSNKCWQLKDKILFQSQLTHYSHFHFQNDSEFHVLQKFKSQIQKFNINSVRGSWKTFLFGIEQFICQTNLEGWMVGMWVLWNLLSNLPIAGSIVVHRFSLNCFVFLLIQ